MPYGPKLGTTVTIFGGTGFIGRYIVQRLAKTGATIRIAVRDTRSAGHLQPLGDVGQIVAVPTNIRYEESVRRAIAGADTVINLVGILYEKGPQTFRRLHVEAPEMIARICGEEGVHSLAHMSALGAGENAPSRYARSKAAGEARVREHFKQAIIMRPSIVFGPGDGFFNLFASMAQYSPVLPLIGGGKTRFQPVYVGDVADAFAYALDDYKSRGKTYELGGPETFTFKEILQLVLHYTGYKRPLVPLPWPVAYLQASVLEKLPRPLLTQDQVAQLRQDNVVAGKNGLTKLGIEPVACETILPTYMDRYRKGGRFSQWRAQANRRPAS